MRIVVPAHGCVHTAEDRAYRALKYRCVAEVRIAKSALDGIRVVWDPLPPPIHSMRGVQCKS